VRLFSKVCLTESPACGSRIEISYTLCMRKILGPEFFDRPTLAVARDLLGKYLVRKVGKREVAAMITETEAYDGPKDLAAHSSKGRTARTEVMWGPAGVWYVYFVYGLHEMLNVVTKKDGAAILIRAVEGHKGPAKLTKFLKIDRSLNRKKADKKSGLWVEDRGAVVLQKEIIKGPRVGIDYAGLWARKPWRFTLRLQQRAEAEAVSPSKSRRQKRSRDAW
jgi:DNA-3-methyladenine glycosylase